LLKRTDPYPYLALNSTTELAYVCCLDVCVCVYEQSLRSICWHHEGKQFVCSHADGSVTIWNFKIPHQPQSYMMPHGIYFLVSVVEMMWYGALNFFCSQSTGDGPP